MSDVLSVSVSGAAFSLLLYETAKSECDQEGFLLGSIVCKETNQITDADYTVVNTTRTITVKSVIPCPQTCYFYDAGEKVNVDKIRNLLHNQPDVVGWYISKRKRSASKLTSLENIIHQQLAEFFSPQISYFTCCVLESNMSSIRSNYTLNQTFLRYNLSKYNKLPFHIINLNDPTYTFKSPAPGSDLVNKIIKTINSSGETEGHEIVKKVQGMLHEYMKELVVKLSEKEQELFKIEQEVKQLQFNLKLKLSSVEAKETNLNNLQVKTEIGSPSCLENTLESLKRKRGRPKRESSGINSRENGTRSSISRENSLESLKRPKRDNFAITIAGMDDDNMNKNESTTPILSRLRPSTYVNVSYYKEIPKRKSKKKKLIS